MGNCMWSTEGNKGLPARLWIPQMDFEIANDELVCQRQHLSFLGDGDLQIELLCFPENKEQLNNPRAFSYNVLPSNWDGNDISATIYHCVSNASSVDTVEWEIAIIAYSDTETLINSDLTDLTSISDAVPVNDTLYISAPTNIEVKGTSPAANDLIIIPIRRVDNESDGAYLFGVLFEYGVA